METCCSFSARNSNIFHVTAFTFGIYWYQWKIAEAAALWQAVGSFFPEFYQLGLHRLPQIGHIQIIKIAAKYTQAKIKIFCHVKNMHWFLHSAVVQQIISDIQNLSAWIHLFRYYEVISLWTAHNCVSE